LRNDIISKFRILNVAGSLFIAVFHIIMDWEI